MFVCNLASQLVPKRISYNLANVIAHPACSFAVRHLVQHTALNVHQSMHGTYGIPEPVGFVSRVYGTVGRRPKEPPHAGLSANLVTRTTFEHVNLHMLEHMQVRGSKGVATKETARYPITHDI